MESGDREGTMYWESGKERERASDREAENRRGCKEKE